MLRRHDALNLMVNYDWPGNVRELENIITRASVLSAETPLTADELSRWLIGSTDPQLAKPTRRFPWD